MSFDTAVKQEMEKVLEHLKKELKSLRTGRANPAILDNVKIEVYGTNMRLRDVANVTTPEARQLLITPYDSNNANSIAKSIDAANLNIQPTVDGNVVRINIPTMDEGVRKDIAKQCKKKAEDAKISIREIRRKFNDLARGQKAGGDITEDLMKKDAKNIQELTDKYCKITDDIAKEKEKEIMEI